MGDIYTVKISSDETHGIYSVWEIEVPPNNGPPLHKHSMEDEAFYVLEGIFSFPYGIKKERYQKKDNSFMLQKVSFTPYKNIGSSFGKLLLIIKPLYIEKFFQEMGIPN